MRLGLVTGEAGPRRVDNECEASEEWTVGYPPGDYIVVRMLEAGPQAGKAAQRAAEADSCVSTSRLSERESL